MMDGLKKLEEKRIIEVGGRDRGDDGLGKCGKNHKKSNRERERERF